MIHRLAAALALFAAPALAAQPAPLPIDAARMSEHVRVLASEPYGGRGPGTPEEEKTVAYIADQFRQAGLSPGGDNGGWTQAVDLWQIETDRPKLQIRGPGGALELTNGAELALGAHSGNAEVALTGAPLVFVGYGVTAPERGWDDFKGLDLHGKVAVFLVNDPDFETPEANTFDGKAMTYQGRWTYKFEEATRRGAIGALVIHEDGPAGYGFESLARSWLQPQFDIVKPDAPARPLFESWINRPSAVKMFALAGLDFETLRVAARNRDFRPVDLTGVAVSTRFSVRRSKIASRNVVGVLRGARYPNETILYSAHWDHLGRGPAGEVFAGAVDNASGVAGLIELARAFGRGRPVQRSVAFVAFTAEEKGLLGSEYYASKPVRPLETTALVLNMDSLSSFGRTNDLVVVSRGRTDLDPIVERIAQVQGRTVTGDPSPEAGTYFRSDHLSLAQKGVPGVSFGIGRDLRNGGRAAGDAAYQAYVRDRYHQAADVWKPDLDLAGAAEDVSALYELGAAIANSRLWPSWSVSEAFKPIRDASAASRK
jgi:Zn-dependent M28 family amino/carboxypeptidase